MGRSGGAGRAQSASDVSASSVSACSARSPPPSGPRQASARQRGGERRRAGRERGDKRSGAEVGQSPQNQTLYMHQAMWMQQPGVPSQMPHPQWPQLFPRPFHGGAIPSIRTLEDAFNGKGAADAVRQQRRQQEAPPKGKKSEEALDEEMREKNKKKSKSKKEKKEKKDKKLKKAKKKTNMACSDEEVPRPPQPDSMVSHLQPSDEDASEQNDNASEPSEKNNANAEEATSIETETPAKGPAATGQVVGEVEVSAERMRQALQALRERREELEQVNSDLDAANADVEDLENQLDTVEEDLEKEREANKALVARSLEDKTQLSQLRSEVQEAQTKTATLGSDVAALRSQLKERESDVDQSRRAKTAVDEELSKTKADLDKTRKDNAVLTDEITRLKSQLTSAQADLIVAKESASFAQAELDKSRAEIQANARDHKKAKGGDAAMLQSKLKHLRSELDHARTELSQSSNEIYSSRRKLASLTEELAKSRRMVVSKEARRALNDSWVHLLSLLEQQLGPDELEAGFHQLGAALQSAGFWSPNGIVNDASDELRAQAENPQGQPQLPEGDCDISPNGAQPLLTRLSSDADIGKSRTLDGQALGKADKSERQGKKKEKKGKAAKEKRKVQEEQDEGEIEPLPHRTCSAGPSALKKRRTGAASSSACEGKRATISFVGDDDLATYVSITAFNNDPLKGKLWFANPLANVTCEKCERRVPQMQGRLQGNPGASQFMQEKFHCIRCVDKVVEQPAVEDT